MWLRCLASAAVASAVLIGPTGQRTGMVCRAADAKKKIERVEKSDAEWRKLLTRKQFAVTRRKETERAYSGRYLRYKRKGDYRCVCCELKLFASNAKYNSRTGWPAFVRPLDEQHVVLATDFSELPVRLEVRCARCDAHLGHVFGDGPPPSGARWCINSAALKFVEAPKKQEAQRTKDADAPTPRQRP